MNLPMTISKSTFRLIPTLSATILVVIPLLMLATIAFPATSLFDMSTPADQAAAPHPQIQPVPVPAQGNTAGQPAPTATVVPADFQPIFIPQPVPTP
jgi:hypothetical protein